MKTNFDRLLLSSALLVGLAALPALRADDAPPPPPPADSGPPPGGDTGTPPPPEHHHGGAMSLARLTSALGLTPDQQPKVGGILKDMAAQRQSIQDDDSLSDDDKHQKMKDLRKSMHEKMAAVLTPDQLTKFEALAKGGGHHKPAPDTPPPAAGDAPDSSVASPAPAGNPPSAN